MAPASSHISATIEPETDQRVRVFFQRLELGPIKVNFKASSRSWRGCVVGFACECLWITFSPSPPPPCLNQHQNQSENYLDTTYLDNDMRISRGGRGNAFVLLRDDPQ